MKPVSLFEYQLLNNTKGGDIVLDSFGGSGTTLIAAEKNGRIARLMELDPKYCDVIVKRWQDFTGQKATLEAMAARLKRLQMAGRKPKPTQLKVLQGAFRKDRGSQREPKPSGDLLIRLSISTMRNAKFWQYAIEHAPRGLLKKLDLSVLEVWVVACVFHRDAVKQVTENGQVVTSPSGYPIVNPYLSNANKQALIMLKAASEMGFTPASRSRIVVAEELVGDDPWAKLASEG
jgi:P27 family predicted phage terminase small subunit